MGEFRVTSEPQERERCENCAHWQNPWDDGEPYLIADHDDVPRWGTCQLIGLASDYEDKVTLPAFTKDGSDYKADLHTRADFGCVLWSQAPVAPCASLVGQALGGFCTCGHVVAMHDQDSRCLLCSIGGTSERADP